MSPCHELALGLDGLEGVRFLIERPALSSNGDLESAFLDTAQDIQRHPSGQTLTRTLAETVQMPDCHVVVLIRNPGLVLDPELPGRIAVSIAALPEPDDWAMGAAGGLGLYDSRHLALYASHRPAIPSTSGPQPLLDPMPDLTLINAAHAKKVLGTAPACLDTGLETILAQEGYLDGRISVFLPQLVAGIDGDLLGRDLNRLRHSLQTHFGSGRARLEIPTLTGPVSVEPKETIGIPAPATHPTGPADAAIPLIARHSPMPGLSIIVRTLFRRPHLLRRLLTSISRARPSAMALEIVLSSDAPHETCTREMHILETEFPNLTLRLCHNQTKGPSRVTNLREGLRAARSEYVAVVDDDDYLDLFAFDNLSPAFFLGNRPLVIASSAVHEEVWENTDSPRPTLARSSEVNAYPASRWREMFDGVNKLPVCAVIAPRDFVCRRLDTVDLTHDLSEDYALFLLLLTAPDLPAIHEVSGTFCHISLRGTENSVGMEDRRPWVRDIAGHLANLTASGVVAGPGLWSQLAAIGANGRTAGHDVAVKDLNQALANRDREIRLLRSETARLRATLETMEETVA